MTRKKNFNFFLFAIFISFAAIHAQSDECLTTGLANQPRLETPANTLQLPIEVTLRLQSISSTLTTNLTNIDIAQYLRRYYGETVTQSCDLPPAPCCGGFITVDAGHVSQSYSGTMLTIKYTALYAYSQFQVCPQNDYETYFTNSVKARQEIYNSFNDNGYTALTSNYALILGYDFQSKLCSDLVTGINSCPGNSVCYESLEEPRAECISVCNTTEYSDKFGEEFCLNDYPCCQTSLDTAGYCECSLYTSGFFVFGSNCATQIPLWAMILIIIGGILLIILVTVLLIYCCCPACCMCCFAKRVERMKQARKAREAKLKEDNERKKSKRSRKSTTPIRQVGQDGSQFYTNRSYAPDGMEEQAFPPPAIQRVSRNTSRSPGYDPDDRMNKALHNGRVLSEIGYKSTAGSTLARNIPFGTNHRSKQDTLMESSIDGFQTGEPSEAASGSSQENHAPPSRNKHKSLPTSSSREHSETPKQYIPKGAVPSIGPPNFQALITEVKQGQDRNRSLSSQVYKEDSSPRDFASRNTTTELKRESSHPRSEASTYNRQDLWRSPGTENLRINTDTYISDV